MVLTLAGVVIAVAGIVALSHLSAIRKSLETLARQGQTPLRPARSEEVSGRILPLEPTPAPPEPVYRPVVVVPPPPAPPPPPPAMQRPRYEEASEQAPPASRPTTVSPPAPPPPAPVHQTLFEEPEPAVEEAPAPPPSRPATTSPPPPPPPAEPGRSRMPTIIGIVVLVAAIGFLIFVVLYTK